MLFSHGLAVALSSHMPRPSRGRSREFMMTNEIQFQRNARIASETLRDLFMQTDWAKQRSLEGIARMLQQTPLHVSAWHNGELIGFARALSDGVYRAVIEDVIVTQQLRGNGIGKKLVKLLLIELVEVEEIMLGCMEELAPFYERFGFKRVTHPVMKRNNHK